MQVLVALYRADGGIVTRDELIDFCWDGRIVGDDAVNRVLSRLRKAMLSIGDGIARIETLNKVGYRLTLAPEYRADASFDDLPSSTRAGRRSVLAWSLGGLVLLSAGGWYMQRRKQAEVPKEILSLLEQSRQLCGQNTREGQYQGIGILRKVVELAPEFADGWGRLGIAYGIVSHFREPPEGQTLRQRAEAAAKRALELDPDNACGEIAFSTALPLIGHYLERDRHQQRALKAEPDNYDAIIYTACTLQFVGRNSEAVTLYRKLKNGPITPADHDNLIRGLWSAGLVEETDQELAKATAIYPTQQSIWLSRLYILLYGGKYSDAVALAHDMKNAPTGTTDDRVASFQKLANALESGDQLLTDEVIQSLSQQARVSSYEAENAIRKASALGCLDDAFAFADAYYFNRGFSVPDFGATGPGIRLDQRLTRLLFEPVTAPMRLDPRFQTLISELGFDQYWRESGTPPDYRRV